VCKADCYYYYYCNNNNLSCYHGSRKRKLITAINNNLLGSWANSNHLPSWQLITCSKIITHEGGFQRHSSWFCISHCSWCSFIVYPNLLFTWIVSTCNTVTHTRPYILLLTKLIHINTTETQEIPLVWNSLSTNHTEQINAILWDMTSSNLVKVYWLFRGSYCLRHKGKDVLWRWRHQDPLKYQYTSTTREIFIVTAMIISKCLKPKLFLIIFTFHSQPYQEVKLYCAE
jgi:hypothetical protein